LETTWGYTNYARDEFKKKYGKDPLTIDVSHPLWQKWIRYRQEKVTDFVSDLKTAAANENIMISAVIFPDIKETAVTKLQDWPEWAKNGYIDAFTPLIMCSDNYRAGEFVRETRKFSDDRVKILPGLFEPFTKGTPVSLLHQIIAVRKAGASGIVIFDQAHLNGDFTKALRTRVLRN
jgi:hypothetical protein